MEFLLIIALVIIDLIIIAITILLLRKDLSARLISLISRKRPREERSRHTDVFDRHLHGPIHTGSGDIHFERVHYGQVKLPPLWLAFAHPRCLSKGIDTLLIATLYPERSWEQIERNLAQDFDNIDIKKIAVQKKETSLSLGKQVSVGLQSNNIDFTPEKNTRYLTNGYNKFPFLARPKDNIQPGRYPLLLSIIDAETEHLLHSETYHVQVVDYAFDHVSRPLISKIGSAGLGLSSLLIYLLTVLEKIDKTLGLTSGTAFIIFAALLFGQFYVQFQRMPNPNIQGEAGRRIT